MLRFISRQNHEYGFYWRVLYKVRLNPSYLLTSFLKNCSCELCDYLPFFPCLFFVLSFIFILLIFTSSCFSSKQNYSSLLCFCFCFWLLYLKHLLCFVSFCCLDVMIWKPDVILIGILSHTTSSIWVFQCSVTYPVPASLSSGPYLTSPVISAQPINLFPPNIQGIKLICEWNCIMKLRF